ncbi:PAS domain-containing sensor histidine kinase [Nitrospira sp. M1]
MNTIAAHEPTRNSKVGRRFTIITVMFLSVLLGMLGYTIITIHNEQSNALLIDIVGRQRMLLQKHLNEVLLTSQHATVDYASTRAIIRSTLDALIDGQAVAQNPVTNQHQKVPVVPTHEVMLKLHEQQNYFDKIIESANQLLLLSPGHADFRRQLQRLRTQHESAISIADDAVKLLNVHSESNMWTMVKWESSIALLVALLGIFVMSQGIRYGKKLENEITERKRAEGALRKSEMFLNSIIEYIPNMIFVKSAKDLRFVRFNQSGEVLTGHSQQAVIGKNDYDLFSKEEADFFTQKDREALLHQRLIDIPEEFIHTKSQQVRHLHTKKIPLFDQHGNPEYVLGISEDITERLRAEEALRQSEERYRTLYEDNPSMYFTVDKQGTVLSVNEFGAQQLGYSVNELVDCSLIELCFPDDRDYLQQRFKGCVESPRTVFSWEFRKVRKDHSVLWVKEVARAVYSQDGTIVVLIVSEDVTGRRETEKALQEWKDLTESILGQLPKGFAYRCLNKKTWPVMYISDGFEDVTGLPTSALLSGDVTYDSLMAPGENERVWPIVQEALAHHTPYENEHQIITKDGTTKWILARGRFIFDDSGQLLYLDGLNVDITEHKQIENQLRASEARFRSLVEHIPFCIHEIELNGIISSMNQVGQKMIGINDESQIIGRSYLSLADEDDHELMRRYFTQAAQGEPVDFEFKVKTHGNMKVFSKSFIPLRDSNDTVVKIVGISEDITERTFAEERFRESEAKRIEALSQSDALKSALLSSVSHELRTPLTAMKTAVSTIIGNTPNGMNTIQQEFLTGVDHEINYMSRLVDNLLDMSQIEAGTLTPHQEWHLLEELIEGALRHTELTIHPRNIEISIPDDLPPVFVDAVEIQQVLINLLDNAIKYSSPNSPIHIASCVMNQHIEVKVSNTGEPLGAQEVEQIFERFYRCPTVRGLPIRGTGLGLAICKGIIEAHGGKIFAKSTGAEVTITFILPQTESIATFTLEGRHKA